MNQCIIYSCPKSEFQTVIVCNGDSDLLILLISVIPLLQEFSLCKGISKFGFGEKQPFFIGEKQKFFNVNSLAEHYPFSVLLQVATLSLVLCNILKSQLNVICLNK